MMDMMMGMGIFWLIVLILLGVAVGAGVYFGLRAAGGSRRPSESALETLQGRLASGEITADEYYERESVLRDGQEARGARR